MKDYFELGRILKPQGVHGEAKAELYTDDPERVRELEYVFFKDSGTYRKQAVVSARTDGRFGYLRFAGIEDRDEAETLRGSIFYIDRAHAVPLPEGAFYVDDLIGLPVFAESGRKLGTLKDILSTGAKDVYVVSLEDGGSLMFPSLGDVFRERSLDKIVLDDQRLHEVCVYDV